jgi:hypothetical protein
MPVISADFVKSSSKHWNCRASETPGCVRAARATSCKVYWQRRIESDQPGGAQDAATRYPRDRPHRRRKRPPRGARWAQAPLNFLQFFTEREAYPCQSQSRRSQRKPPHWSMPRCSPGASTKEPVYSDSRKPPFRIVLREFWMYKGVNQLEALTFIVRENGCVHKATPSITRSITRQE